MKLALFILKIEYKINVHKLLKRETKSTINRNEISIMIVIIVHMKVRIPNVTLFIIKYTVKCCWKHDKPLLWSFVPFFVFLFVEPRTNLDLQMKTYTHTHDDVAFSSFLVLSSMSKMKLLVNML